MYTERPVWAEISTADILHNYQEIKRLVGSGVKIMPVLKANAYGHGAVKLARMFEQENADCFAVALLNEAVQLREAGISKPILILGWTPPEDYVRALAYNITLTIYSAAEAQNLSGLAAAQGKTAVVHLKIDTGMGRIGLSLEETGIQEAEAILGLPGLNAEGIFTHFAKADERDKSCTKKQLDGFQRFVAAVEERTGYRFPIKHAANSAAIIDHPEAYLDMVRPGIILYGLQPSDKVDLSKINLRQAISLRARVSHVKRVPPGHFISYGGTFRTARDSVIATLPLGYADGYTRLFTGKAKVLYKGNFAPIVGRICMDQCLVDATELNDPVQPGDTMTLIGTDHGSMLKVDDLAEWIGTINYEIVCMIGARVPRIYV